MELQNLKQVRFLQACMVSLPFCRSHLSIPGTIDIIHVTWIGNVTPAAIYVSYTVYVKKFVAGVFNFVVFVDDEDPRNFFMKKL